MLIRIFFSLDDLEPLLTQEIVKMSSQPIDAGSVTLEFEEDDNGDVDAVSVTFFRESDRIEGGKHD